MPSPRAFDRRPPYFVAVGLVAVATTLRVAVDPWLGVSVPYLFFHPAIMIAAIFGGVWPGVLATIFSGFLSVFLYLAPAGTVMVHATSDIVALVLFVANGLLMSRVGGIARRAAVREQELAAIVQSSDDAIVGKDLNGTIRRDQRRLRQVVWNLLSNAVKFTPAGGRVAVNVGASDGHAELQVTDTGMGITGAFLPYVFDKFRQADASFTREHGGLGLGLAIARHLIELHGGSIEARSAGEGTGATFVVRLPLQTPAAAD